jgi:hypothetical protein
MVGKPLGQKALIAATTLCSALLAAPIRVDAACFEPNQSAESQTTSGCAVDGYVTGQIATPGAKLIGRFLQQKINSGMREDSIRELQPFSYVLPDGTNTGSSARAFAPVRNDSFSIAQAMDGAPTTVDPARLGRPRSPALARFIHEGNFAAAIERG